MKILNDLTFTYAYWIENYSSLTLKTLEGGGLYSTPRGVSGGELLKYKAFPLEILWLFPLLNVELRKNKTF